MEKYIASVVLLFLFGFGCTQNIQPQTQDQTESVSAPSDTQVKVGQSAMQLSSNMFQHGESIPTKYTCDGEDINPSFTISDVPENTKSLALIVDDPDAPVGTWVHWVVWNIDPTIGTIKENSKPGLEGLTSSGETKWGGPCPPSGTHRYYFKLYALDTMLPESTKELIDADALQIMMQDHIVQETQLMGMYGVK